MFENLMFGDVRARKCSKTGAHTRSILEKFAFDTTLAWPSLGLAPMGLALMGLAPLGLAPLGLAPLGLAPLGLAPLGLAYLKIHSTHQFYTFSLSECLTINLMQ